MRGPRGKQIAVSADEADQDRLAEIAEEVGTSQTGLVLAFVRLWARLPEAVKELIATEARAIASQRRPGRRRTPKATQEDAQ